jgi:hypothetical protein
MFDAQQASYGHLLTAWRGGLEFPDQQALIGLEGHDARHACEGAGTAGLGGLVDQARVCGRLRAHVQSGGPAWGPMADRPLASPECVFVELRKGLKSGVVTARLSLRAAARRQISPCRGRTTAAARPHAAGGPHSRRNPVLGTGLIACAQREHGQWDQQTRARASGVMLATRVAAHLGAISDGPVRGRSTHRDDTTQPCSEMPGAGGGNG